MPLDPQAQKFLQQLEQVQFPRLNTMEPVEAREMLAKLQGKPLNPQPLAKVENRTIPSADGDIAIRIYTPTDSKSLPILVYFHGGGWVIGDLEAVDSLCRSLSLNAECIVVSVNYRLAPEHKFPAAIEDAYAATNWVAKNAAALNGDSTRIAVGGGSAGGNLAAVVALMARDRGEPSLIYQLLIYPVTQYGFETDSYQEYGQGDCGLSKQEMIWFWQHYISSETDKQNPYTSPLAAENLSALPPACIVTAECDVLRDEAEAYANRLQAAGIPVQLKRYDGMIHTFVTLAEVLDKGQEAIAYISAQLRLAFSGQWTVDS